MKKQVLFLDMDGVLADFDGALPADQKTTWNPPAMFEPGFFRNLAVLAGAKEAVARLLADGRFKVYIGSKGTSKVPACFTEKAEWIAEHFPELKTRIVLCCCKSLLAGDYLIDDDEDRWSGKFPGTFVHFDHQDPAHSWDAILNLLGVA